MPKSIHNNNKKHNSVSKNKEEEDPEIKVMMPWFDNPSSNTTTPHRNSNPSGYITTYRSDNESIVSLLHRWKE